MPAVNGYVETSTRASLARFTDQYFDLRSDSPCWITALKVLSYVTLIFPAIVLCLKLYLSATSGNPIRVAQPERQEVPRDLAECVNLTPPFNGYVIGEAGTRFEGLTLTGVSIRPANLFFDALLGPGATTMPGSGRLFAFTVPHAEIRDQINGADRNEVVEISAQGVRGEINRREVRDLADLYGNGTCRFSFGELQDMLGSQRIYASPLLPLPFYRELKAAMLADQLVVLPGHDGHPVKLKDMNSDRCRELMLGAANRWAELGFASREACEQLLNLTVYQVGSLVVKSEDYRVLLDNQNKLRERQVGENDAIRLINACGIRGIFATRPTEIDNRTIMTQAFQTSLIAAERGYVVFPAVGMGVWRGDPNLYWRAFLDAVVTNGNAIEHIFVNPGHQTTQQGLYRGCNGNEFQVILDEYRRAHAQNPAALANLNKIINLFEQGTDVVQLATRLKAAHPDKIVSLFNASDPDVTLCYHVGEYVNNLNHANTTEENYTALGTNGLLFETITGVHEDDARLIQA